MRKVCQIALAVLCLGTSAATVASSVKPTKSPIMTITIVSIATPLARKNVNSTPIPLSAQEASAVRTLTGGGSFTEKLPPNCFRVRECDGKNCTVTIECY
jgi:hypothetical protein